MNEGEGLESEAAAKVFNCNALFFDGPPERKFEARQVSGDNKIWFDVLKWGITMIWIKSWWRKLGRPGMKR